MTIRAIIPGQERDLRLDLFRGAANWAIFIDHIPNNGVMWLTTRKYGFSDAAELFVFIAGYAASILYSKIMLKEGFAFAVIRLVERAWQLYAAHVILLIVYTVVICWAAQTYDQLQFLHEYNVAGFSDRPVATLTQGLLLNFKPLNLDILPLYVVLLTSCAPLLWLMLRRPNLTIVASLIVYVAARELDWHLPAYPTGVWYFNPFTWQFLFFLGAWCALGGALALHKITHSAPVLIFCLAYVIFALLTTMAGRSDIFGGYCPNRFLIACNGNDKTNLDPHRILHFSTVAILVVRFIPSEWPGLRSRILRPMIVCGQHSLEVFCVGTILSFAGYFLLAIVSQSLLAQMIVSIFGIGLLSGVGYFRQWSKSKVLREKTIKTYPEMLPN